MMYLVLWAVAKYTGAFVVSSADSIEARTKALRVLKNSGNEEETINIIAVDRIHNPQDDGVLASVASG